MQNPKQYPVSRVPSSIQYVYPVTRPDQHLDRSEILALQYVSNKAQGRISKRVFHKNKARKILPKKNISYPLIRTRMCVYQGVRNVRFSENLACFVFLKHMFSDSHFCLITDEYYRVLL